MIFQSGYHSGCCRIAVVVSLVCHSPVSRPRTAFTHTVLEHHMAFAQPGNDNCEERSALSNFSTKVHVRRSEDVMYMVMVVAWQQS